MPSLSIRDVEMAVALPLTAGLVSLLEIRLNTGWRMIAIRLHQTAAPPEVLSTRTTPP